MESAKSEIRILRKFAHDFDENFTTGENAHGSTHQVDTVGKRQNEKKRAAVLDRGGEQGDGGKIDVSSYTPKV